MLASTYLTGTVTPGGYRENHGGELIFSTHFSAQLFPQVLPSTGAGFTVADARPGGYFQALRNAQAVGTNRITGPRP